MENQTLIKVRVGSVEFEVSGREEFVDSQLRGFLERLRAGAFGNHHSVDTATPSPGLNGFMLGAPSHVPPPPEPPKAPPSLLEFYKQRAPSTDVDRVTVLAAYSRDHKSMGEVTEDSLHPLFRELAVLGQQPAKNITHGIWNAASKGRAYLERVEGKRGAYRLTNAGAALVYSTLPEQAKAKENGV
ncbi:MAG: hypothetical protein HY681_12310 [Chloroflexi bacterium]|nr:hypothetical protein [Chloroflexota bacterium]